MHETDSKQPFDKGNRPCADEFEEFVRRHTRPVLELDEGTHIANASDLRCCVRDGSFKCPEQWAYGDESIPGGMEVLILFQGSVEFMDGVEEVGCECDCCEFEQYVESKVSWTAPRGEEVSLDTGGAHVEDCRLHADEASVSSVSAYVQARRQGRDLVADMRESGAVANCYGERDSDHHPDDYRGPGQCEYMVRDRASLHVGGPFRYHATFPGQVVDICHRRVVRAEREFVVEWTFPPAQEPTVEQVNEDGSRTPVQPDENMTHSAELPAREAR